MENERTPAQFTTIWIGAFLFYMLNAFKGNFSDYAIDKYQDRNLFTGWIIQIGLLNAILLILFF